MGVIPHWHSREQQRSERTLPRVGEGRGWGRKGHHGFQNFCGIESRTLHRGQWLWPPLKFLDYCKTLHSDFRPFPRVSSAPRAMAHNIKHTCLGTVWILGLSPDPEMPSHWDVKRILDSSVVLVTANSTQDYKGNSGHGPQPTYKESCLNLGQKGRSFQTRNRQFLLPGRLSTGIASQHWLDSSHLEVCGA